jgi:hypothetical protein
MTATPSQQSCYIDVAFATFAVLIFAVIAYSFQYRESLGESDLYRILVGLLDGKATGSELAGALQYNRPFGFGYIAALYVFLNDQILRSPPELIAVINNIGLWGAISALIAFWISTRLVYGTLAATVALIIFASAPMVLEMSTTGHPIILSFALIGIASIFMFLDLSRGAWILAQATAIPFLVAALAVRGDIVLAFPWLVLTRIDTQSLRHFVKSGVLYCLAPTSALVLFYILKLCFANFSEGAAPGSLNWFVRFFSWANIVPAIAYLGLGCGIVTTVIGGLLVLWSLKARSKEAGGSRRDSINLLLGPLTLVAFTTIFWIGNPQPARHFLLVLAGFAILIGFFISRNVANHFFALTSALAIACSNQLSSEALRPILLRQLYSPYISIPDERRTFTHVPVGFWWLHHGTLKMRRDKWNELADQIATTCDDYTLVLSDEIHQLLASLYSDDEVIVAKRVELGKFLAYSAVRSGRHYIFMSKIEGWPEDAVAFVLADHGLDAYKIFVDPYTISAYDRTAVPPKRAARLGCAAKLG